MVVLQSASGPLALAVDELIGEQETVIKTIDGLGGDVPGVSGASILGDGSVALIFDVTGFAKEVRRLDSASSGMTAVMERALSRSAEALSRFLGDRMLRPADVALTDHKLAELPVMWGAEDTPVAAVALEVGGDLEGYLVLAIPMESWSFSWAPRWASLTWTRTKSWPSPPWANWATWWGPLF